MRRSVERAGLESAMLCFSPDFTHPDPAYRQRQLERQRGALDLCTALGIGYCRVLSGQRRPEVGRQQGIDYTVEAIRRCLEWAAPRGIVLCMENHYKDGTWRQPEFAQHRDTFLAIVRQIDSPWFGVQYDPSNATVGGYDPIAFLDEIADRVVTVHASDRYLKEGASLDDLAAGDGAAGYADVLLHGETGRGLNDYDAIFQRLAAAGFRGWISVEDGVEGLDQLRRSVEFLQRQRDRFFGAA